MRKPLYYQQYYAKIYENEELSKKLDNVVVAQILSFFQKNKINKSVLKDVKEKDKVLVVGISFGDLIDNIAQTAKKIDILDVSKTQLGLLESKFDFVHSNVTYILGNAAVRIDGKYDVVICNNLLHEVPIVSKSHIVNNCLLATKKDGKTIFVDYHRPNKRFLFTYFIRMFNRLYQPFAEKVWDKAIDTYAKEKHLYTWRKTTFFYGCFQKVVVKARNIVS